MTYPGRGVLNLCAGQVATFKFLKSDDDPTMQGAQRETGNRKAKRPNRIQNKTQEFFEPLDGFKSTENEQVVRTIDNGHARWRYKSLMS